MANTAQHGPSDAPTGRATTLGELRASGYRSRSVKEELRQNLIRRLEADEPKFEGIVGFEDTVVPQVENALLSGQGIIFLAERVQVGLLNIMEERDVQIRGYKVRLPLDLFVIASANPEDYTNRGRIITPLKDRFGSQIRTHYPKTIEHEMDIMEQERGIFRDEEYDTLVPAYMREIVAEVTHLARKSPEISQRSGVSVRVSVANYENMLSNALRRAIRLHEKQVAPRISDLVALTQSTGGKIELETVGDRDEEKVIDKLLQKAVLNVFNRHFALHEFDELLAGFDNGLKIDVGDTLPSLEYVRQAAEVAGFTPAIKKLGGQGNPAQIASAIELVLEGLHLNRKLNKDRTGGHMRYRS